MFIRLHTIYEETIPCSFLFDLAASIVERDKKKSRVRTMDVVCVVHSWLTAYISFFTDFMGAPGGENVRFGVTVRCYSYFFSIPVGLLSYSYYNIICGIRALQCASVSPKLYSGALSLKHLQASAIPARQFFVTRRTALS